MKAVQGSCSGTRKAAPALKGRGFESLSLRHFYSIISTTLTSKKCYVVVMREITALSTPGS